MATAAPVPETPGSPSAPLWRAPLAALLAMLGLFTLTRIGICVLYRGDFTEVTTREWLFALIHGLRFDLWCLAVVCGVPLVLLVLPLPFAARGWWRWPLAGLVFAGAALLIVGLGSDLCYYPHVHRHLGREEAIFLDDLPIARSLIALYWYAVVIALALFALGGWWWFRLISRPVAVPPMPGRTWRSWRSWRSWLPLMYFLILLGVMVLIIRGAIWSKPIAVINAFEGTSLAGGQLTLNGPFTFIKAMEGASIQDVTWMAPTVAEDHTRSAIIGDHDASPHPEHPLARSHFSSSSRAQPGSKANIVIVLLESWNPAYIDAYRAIDGKPPLGLTPEFDRLAKDGQLFTRCYANGERSVHGIGAILASIPTPPGLPLLGEGLELTRMEWLPRIAKANGWHSLFVQGSNRASYRVDQICAIAGFDDYYGAQDVPLVMDPSHPPSNERGNGAFDDDMFQFALGRLDAAPKPVLGMCFTLGTHGPFYVPDDRWRQQSKDARNTGWSEGFSDCLRYSDWALGRFVGGLRSKPWAADTWLILVADHLSGWDLHGEDPDSLHRIPCLIVPPLADPLTPTGPIFRSSQNHAVMSQVDLTPTIMDLCGWNGTWSGLGRSLLVPGSRNALCVHGDLTSWVETDGWVVHSGERRLRGEGPGTEDRSLRLLAVQQTLIRALLRNEVVLAPGTVSESEP